MSDDDGDASLRRTADRVASLLTRFDAVTTPRAARELGEELARTIVSLYGTGLERVLTIAHDAAGERACELFARLCDDPFVESLLCLHGLHPLAVEDRVQRALDGVRPYLRSHEGDVTIARVADGVVTLRLQGSCEGCPSSATTIRLAVERAILERVPEIIEVRAENVTAAHAGSHGSLRLDSGWLALDEVPELARGALAAREIEGTPVLLARFDDTIVAYRNRCARCAAALDGGRLERPYVRCAHCGAAYDLVRAGRCAGAEHAFIEPFPLAREDGRIRISIPLAV